MKSDDDPNIGAVVVGTVGGNISPALKNGADPVVVVAMEDGGEAGQPGTSLVGSTPRKLNQQQAERNRRISDQQQRRKTMEFEVHRMRHQQTHQVRAHSVHQEPVRFEDFFEIYGLSQFE